MIIKIGEKQVELKYTYNSFKYMGEFDISIMNDIANKPFKMINTLEILLMGAVNNNKNIMVSDNDVADYIEETIANGNLVELMEKLMTLLQESDFFKSLQKTETSKVKPKKK